LSDRNFDPEATREVARTDMPALADAYEALEQLVVDAGGHLETNAVSEEAAKCAVTATSMAEFLATSGYLDQLHAGIEAAIDGGM
jgi:hypothetical protein